jgi:VWFA-related protein
VTRAGAALPLILIAALIAAAGSGSAAGQQSSFRATVDLVAVTVQVVDGGGVPITSLDRDKFEVTIDGQRRRVVSSDLVQFAASGTGGPDLAAAAVEPSGDRRDRTFILVVDASTFEAGEALQVIKAAHEFVHRLNPDDVIAVFSLPFGTRVDPTLERAKVHVALDRITGQRPTMSGQFNLSTSEIIDIMAQSNSRAMAFQSPAPSSGRGVVVPEPLTIEGDALERVALRECRRPGDAVCTQAIVSEASALALQLEERARRSLNGLSSLLEAIQSYPGRKTIVMLSGGMPVSDRPGGRVDIGDEAGSLGERAARANAVIYAMHVDDGMTRVYTAQSRRIRDAKSVARERVLEARLLEEFAASSGGALLPVNVGAGEVALDRVLRETSAYYLLGVEPGNADRDGKAHRLRVRVNHRGATIRSRQWVVLPKPGG